MKKRAIWFLIAGVIILILPFALADLSLRLKHILLNVAFYVIAISVYLSSLPRDETMVLTISSLRLSSIKTSTNSLLPALILLT